MAWRDLGPNEIAGRDETRLAGSLLWIVIAAAFLAVVMVAIVLLFVFGQVLAAFAGVHLDLLRTVMPSNRGVGLLFMLPLLYVLAWSVVFVSMTWMRAPSTPTVAAVGMAIWVALRLVLGVAGYVVIGVRSGGLVAAIVPLVLSLVAETMLAIAFWVYMQDGTRPNGYYRRRVRA